MKPNTGVYLGLACLSAAPLAFEVALTRLFALAQGHHFAFMAISLALLGGGASGTVLTLRPPGVLSGHRWLSLSALFFTLTLPASYLLVNVIPFDMYRIALEPVQLGWLALYYLVLTIPFFFSGLAVGAALVSWPGRASRLYAANLLGAAVGPPLALLGLATLGGPRTVLALAFLGCLAYGLFIRDANEHHEPGHRPSVKAPRRFLFTLLLGAICASLFLLPPAVTDIRLTPYQALSQVLFFPDSRVVSQTWNAFSRVDVVASEAIRSAPGLSMAFRGRLPPQIGLIVDGQNLSPITPIPAETTEFADYLPPALAYRLRPQANVLVVEPGGWLAVLTALRGAARQVTVVQSNPAMADAVRRWGGDLSHDSRVNLVVEDSRSYLRRKSDEYDLVVLPLTDSFRPVTAGAYALGEDYRYTVESLQEMLDHVSINGLVVAERWLQLPPSESLRLWATVVEAMRRSGVSDPSAHLIALRSLQTSLIIGARTPLSADDVNTVRAFAGSRQFDLIWTPEWRPLLPDAQETLLVLRDEQLAAMGINRYNVMPGAPHFKTFVGALAAPDPGAFYRDYEYAVEPSTDDRPFFFHFFKWRQTPAVLAALGRTWQPFGGSGYLVFVMLLALVLVLSVALILVPLAIRGRSGAANAQPTRAGVRLRYLAYFSLLGLGFLFIEIPLLQRFILYVGQPAYAFAVVVSALLLASGLGSRYLSERLPSTASLAVLAGLGLAYLSLLSPLFDATMGLPLAVRAAIGGVALAPLGLLMGTPFPQGLARARAESPGLLPWIWAVNGCASVVSAVLAPMLAIDEGFQVVMILGAAAYLCALVASLRPRAALTTALASTAQKPHRPS
jgi:spermidine synthase